MIYARSAKRTIEIEVEPISGRATRCASRPRTAALLRQRDRLRNRLADRAPAPARGAGTQLLGLQRQHVVLRLTHEQPLEARDVAAFVGGHLGGERRTSCRRRYARRRRRRSSACAARSRWRARVPRARCAARAPRWPRDRGSARRIPGETFGSSRPAVPIASTSYCSRSLAPDALELVGDVMKPCFAHVALELGETLGRLALDHERVRVELVHVARQETGAHDGRNRMRATLRPDSV